MPWLPEIEPEEKELLPRPALVMAARTNLEGMRDFFEDILPHIEAFVDEHGLEPAGPPFVRYLDMASDVMQIEGGLPLSAPVAGTGAIRLTELSGGRVVSAWHEGTYDAVAETHEALGRWIRDHGLSPAVPPWETYWVGPRDTQDRARWRTEIVVPVHGRGGG